MRIIFFSDFNDHPTHLFSKAKLLEFIGFIQFYPIFVNKCVSGSLHPLFSQLYLFANDHLSQNIRFASNDLPKIPTNNTSIYVRKSFETSTISSLNFFQCHFTDINLKQTSVNQIKHSIYMITRLHN